MTIYEDSFKLQARPFLAAPQIEHYFPASIIENARQSLSRAIARGTGAGLIIGPAGTGKTLLCHMLGYEFRERFAVALLANGRLSTRHALLQAILYELRLPYRGLDEGESRLALLDALEPRPDGIDGLLLIVDEAHALPGKLLEEIRLLTNLVRAGQPRVRVVLAGAPRLDERFASPALSAFSQRIAARCYLEPLDSVETAAYVRAQIECVGGDAARLLTDDALRAVYRATDGVPRLINQVCDHALILADLAGLEQLTSETIDEAWADLQQLPGPWTQKAAGEPSEIVEFGSLGDADDDAHPSAIPFPVAESRELQVAEPDQPFDSTVKQLPNIDRSFEPAPVPSEVDLEFPEFGDPFSEEFAQEEIVLERYGSPGDCFASVPKVRSWEGRQLGNLMEPAAEHRIEFAPAKPAPHPAGQQSQPSPKLPAVSRGSAVKSGTASAAPDAPLRIRTSLEPSEADSDAPELIVVEDQWPAQATLTKVAQARKLEYGQLFSRLRRG
ncbi:MAG TPA: AAA family ATPase [Pirellulales bacterium]